MSINDKGLFYVKSTTISVEPDLHACSYNQLKTVRVEQEGGTVLLNKFDIEEINKLLEK